jgi:hypothetical protein
MIATGKIGKPGEDVVSAAIGDSVAWASDSGS